MWEQQALMEYDNPEKRLVLSDEAILLVWYTCVVNRLNVRVWGSAKPTRFPWAHAQFSKSQFVFLYRLQ